MRTALSGAELHAAIARSLAALLSGRCHAWIIGSEATGRARPGSDIDIALEADRAIPLEMLARIRDELESLPTIRSFDLVDLRRTSERFRREALSQAIPLPLAEEASHDAQG